MFWAVVSTCVVLSLRWLISSWPGSLVISSYPTLQVFIHAVSFTEIDIEHYTEMHPSHYTKDNTED